MTRSDIEAKVIDVMSDKLGLSKADVTMNKIIIDDLGADSLDGVEIAMELEDAYDIEIPDEAIEKATKATVKDVVDYLTKLLVK
jgi:acyl carrier protein